MGELAPAVPRARPRPGRTLVVGYGFLGSHVAQGLAAAGSPPVVLTRSPAPDAPKGLDLRVGDAAGRHAVEAALEGVEHVAFCAGGLLPVASEKDPDLDAQLTLRPLETVLDALAGRPGVDLVYLSSGGTVYGDPERVPTSEDHPARPIGAYGQLRLACEELVERHRRDHGVRARVLRCATVYGERQRPDRGQGAVATFLRRIELGEPITVFSDGSDARDYVYAGDVARVVAALVGRTDGPSVVNVGSGCGTSLSELIALVETQVGRRADVVRRPSRPFDVHRIVLDIERLRRLTGFEPTPLAAGVEATHRWLSQSSAYARVA